MTREELVDEAYEWAYQRASEAGDVDIHKDYVIIEAWVDEYINWYLENMEG